MRPLFANWFGVAGGAIAVLAAVAYAYSVTLPYRLSLQQHALLDATVKMQIFGPFVAIAFACVALRGNSRARRFGFVTVALAVLVLLAAMSANHAHSTGRL